MKRRRLFSTSDCRVSRSASADLFGRFERAAAREDGEAGEELLLLGCEQVVAPLDGRAERLLAGVESRPPLSRSRRSERRSRIWRGESAFALAAASSTASGSESRRTQSSAISSLGSSCARSQKRETASGSASGGTGYSTSPEMRRSSRLVTRSVRLGQACEKGRERGRCLDHLLEVVEQEEQLALARCARRDRPSRRASARSSR